MRSLPCATASKTFALSLNNDTGDVRKPGVHIRPRAESPKESQRSHLNPGFKVVSQASTSAENAFFLPSRRVAGTSDDEPGRMTDRPALRRRLRDQRRALAAPARIAAAERLAGHLLEMPELPRAGYVAGYWASDGEIGLHVFQMRLPGGLSYCLPVLHGDVLRFAPWRAGDPLVTNRYGIPEPDVEPSSALDARDMSVVITPLVGFDARGHRLGMGGGWYDRSFAFRLEQAAPPLLVGAGFAQQQLDVVDAAEWDVPLDAVATECGILRPPPSP